MRNLLKNKPLFIAVVAVVLLLILAICTSGSRTLSWVESSVGTVVEPVQGFASRASGAIIDFVERLFHTTDADKENEQLKVYIAQLEENVNEIDALKQENERLKALLAFKESTPELTYVSGMIIGRNQGIWFDTFTINIGRDDGVEKNMPVVNASGLVGRVGDVGASWSKVVAVIDQSMSVSVMVERTRDIGMIRGTLQSGSGTNAMELYYLSSDADIQPNDRIVTTGIGGLYPKGLLVGTVTEVSRSGENDYNALVSPSVDFKHIEEVMVVAGMPEVSG